MLFSILRIVHCMQNREMPLQFSPFEKCHCNSQDSSKNATSSLWKMPLQWHFLKDERWSAISRFRMNCSGIYLINPYIVAPSSVDLYALSVLLENLLPDTYDNVAGKPQVEGKRTNVHEGCQVSRLAKNKDWTYSVEDNELKQQKPKRATSKRWWKASKRGCKQSKKMDRRQ